MNRLAAIALISTAILAMAEGVCRDGDYGGTHWRGALVTREMGVVCGMQPDDNAFSQGILDCHA